MRSCTEGFEKMRHAFVLLLGVSILYVGLVSGNSKGGAHRQTVSQGKQQHSNPKPHPPPHPPHPPKPKHKPGHKPHKPHRPQKGPHKKRKPHPRPATHPENYAVPSAYPQPFHQPEEYAVPSAYPQPMHHPDPKPVSVGESSSSSSSSEEGKDPKKTFEKIKLKFEWEEGKHVQKEHGEEAPTDAVKLMVLKHSTQIKNRAQLPVVTEEDRADLNAAPVDALSFVHYTDGVNEIYLVKVIIGDQYIVHVKIAAKRILAVGGSEDFKPDVDESVAVSVLPDKKEQDKLSRDEFDSSSKPTIYSKA